MAGKKTVTFDRVLRFRALEGDPEILRAAAATRRQTLSAYLREVAIAAALQGLGAQNCQEALPDVPAEPPFATFDKVIRFRALEGDPAILSAAVATRQQTLSAFLREVAIAAALQDLGAQDRQEALTAIRRMTSKRSPSARKTWVRRRRRRR